MASLIGQTIAGRYQLKKLLGRGGVGAVYEAQQISTSRLVAVKLVRGEDNSDSEMLARFEVEARAAGMLDSDHIAQVFDFGRDQERELSYLAMECLRGESARELLKRRRLPLDVALRIGMQAGRGLAASHARGVLHRDIKPENIFLSVRDRGRVQVKLLDFGMARITRDANQVVEQDLVLTTASTRIGSPLYMSPEQTNGLIHVDERSEVFSFGVVLFELIAGVAPHGDAARIIELIVRICQEQVPLREQVPDVPEEVAAVVDRALAIHPEMRWPNMAAMLKQLEPLVPDERLHVDMLQDEAPAASQGDPDTLPRPLFLKSNTALMAKQAPADSDPGGPDDWSDTSDTFKLTSTTGGLAMRSSDVLKKVPPARPVLDTLAVPDGAPYARTRGVLLAAIAALASVVAGWLFLRPYSSDTAPQSDETPVVSGAVQSAARAVGASAARAATASAVEADDSGEPAADGPAAGDTADPEASAASAAPPPQTPRGNSAGNSWRRPSPRPSPRDDFEEQF